MNGLEEDVEMMMDDPRRNDRRRFVKVLGAGLGMGLTGLVAGCSDLTGPLPEKGKAEDCSPSQGSDCELEVEFYFPCDPQGPEEDNEIRFGLEPGDPARGAGIEDILFEWANVDRCGYVNTGYGQWVQMTRMAKITDLAGDDSARERFGHIIGKCVEFLVFPKTEGGEGSTLIRVNGDRISNAATRYEYSIQQSGLSPGEGDPCQQGPLYHGLVNAFIDYRGSRVAESVLSKDGSFDIPDDARTKVLDLVELYGVGE